MKTIALLFIIIITVYILQVIMPWWILAFVCFTACFIYKPGSLQSFSISFISIFVVWFAKAWIADSNADGNIAGLTGQILGNLSSFSVLFLTAFLGAISGGLSGLSGNILNELLLKKSLV